MQKHSLFDSGIASTGIITLPVCVFVRKTMCMCVFNILLMTELQHKIIYTHTHTYVYAHIQNFGSYMCIHIY